MSSNPEVDGIVALRPDPFAVQALPEIAPAPELEADALPPVGSPAEPITSPARKSRPKWLPSVAVGAVAVVALSTLGYFLNSTTDQRNAVSHELSSTQATLASNQQDLGAARKDAAARMAVATYVSFYVVNHGRVQTDYGVFNNCDNFSQCRTAAQQMLTDMQTFQSERTSASVPNDLANSNSMLGDSLSAAIAATQEIVSALDNGDFAKYKAAYKKLDAAMLSMAKAEGALGAAIR